MCIYILEYMFINLHIVSYHCTIPVVYTYMYSTDYFFNI